MKSVIYIIHVVGIINAFAARSLASLEYRVPRRSLSSGAHLRDPLAGRDDVGCGSAGAQKHELRVIVNPPFQFSKTFRRRERCRFRLLDYQYCVRRQPAAVAQ